MVRAERTDLRAAPREPEVMMQQPVFKKLALIALLALKAMTPTRMAAVIVITLAALPQGYEPPQDSSRQLLAGDESLLADAMQEIEHDFCGRLDRHLVLSPCGDRRPV
jgi:hypothetical protein